MVTIMIYLMWPPCYTALSRWKNHERKKQMIQVMNCKAMGHGHSRSYCHYPVRCVRFGQSHASSECSKTKEEAPTSANCGLQHTTNNHGSIVYKQLQQVQRNPPQKNLCIQQNIIPATLRKLQENHTHQQHTEYMTDVTIIKITQITFKIIKKLCILIF